MNLKSSKKHKIMKKESIKIEIDLNKIYIDEERLKSQIEERIINTVVNGYLKEVEPLFKKKIEQLVIAEAQKTVTSIKKIPLDKCDIAGIKQTMTLDEYIIKRFIDSLSVRVDDQGRSDSYSYGDKKTPIDWAIFNAMKSGGMKKEIDVVVQKVNEYYRASINELIMKTLNPIYEQLLLKLKS
jgi:hypothetical protein